MNFAATLSESLRQRITKVVDSMVFHMDSILVKERKRISGLVVYFKIDPHGHLWCTLCTSLRTKSVVGGLKRM